jgi:hypothetical protein
LCNLYNTARPPYSPLASKEALRSRVTATPKTQQCVWLETLVRVRHELVMKMFASGSCGTERPLGATLGKVGPHPSSFRDDIPEVETGCMSNHAGCRPSLAKEAKVGARVWWLMRRFSLRLSSLSCRTNAAGRGKCSLHAKLYASSFFYSSFYFRVA